MMIVPMRKMWPLTPQASHLLVRQLGRCLWSLSGVIGVLVGLLAWQTWTALLPFPASLSPDNTGLRRAQVLDRAGLPLSVTFQNPWNVHDVVPLHDLPLFLQQAFIA